MWKFILTYPLYQIKREDEGGRLVPSLDYFQLQEPFSLDAGEKTCSILKRNGPFWKTGRAP